MLCTFILFLKTRPVLEQTIYQILDKVNILPQLAIHFGMDGVQAKHLIIIGFNIFGLQVLESGNGNISDQCVQFVGRVFIVITATSQAYTHTEWSGSDTLGPDVLVQAGIDSNIIGAHFLFGEFADFLNGTRSTLLEANVVHTLGQVNSALAGDYFIDGGFVALLTFCFGHFLF
uniref:Uncharacterized protein n=1 Tax=Haematobia irritans TaxID=7368 RepID=A0A1L8E6B4_HAEIR